MGEGMSSHGWETCHRPNWGCQGSNVGE